MIRMGSWIVHSENDKRWNKHGRCVGSIFCVPDMEKWIEKCKKNMVSLLVTQYKNFGRIK